MGSHDLLQLDTALKTRVVQEENSLGYSDALGKKGDCDEEMSLDHFIRVGNKVVAGIHLIIELMGGRNIDDPALMEKAFRCAVDSCGATLLHVHLHQFSPCGVSGVAVLAESHISVHTWPEKGYAAFDVFMCGQSRPWVAVDIFKRFFHPTEIRVTELLRGDGIV